MTLARQGKSDRRRASLLLVAVASAAGALLAAIGLGATERATATHVAPVPISSGNPTCGDFAGTYGGGQTWLEFTIGASGGGLTNGNYVVGPGMTITISNAGVEGGVYRFDWSATFGVDAVFVKQANDSHNLYVYAPTAASPEATADTDLQPQLGQNQGGVSHVSFCYDSDPPTPTPTTPTATPTTPTATPTTPTATPTTPTATPTTPTATPTTPTATPTTPTATPTTPTATPTTPTATLTTPTATATATPTGTLTPTNTPAPTETPATIVAPGQPTSTPTVVETVAGARATPIVPSAGTGITAAGKSDTLALAFIGLLTLASGAASIALVTGRRQD